MPRSARLSLAAISVAFALAILLLVTFARSSTLAMVERGAARTQLVAHTVRRGDTMDALARRYGVSAAEIIAANSETGVLPLYRGSEIIVPVLVTPEPARPYPAVVTLPAGAIGVTYMVRRGDRLSVIAEHFGVTVEEIAAANGLSKRMLYVGQQLVIPVLQEKTAAAKRGEDEQLPGLPRITLSPALTPRAAVTRAAAAAAPDMLSTEANAATAPAAPSQPVTVEVPVVQVVTVTERVPITVVERITVTAPAPPSEPVRIEIPVTQVVTVTEHVPVTQVKTVTVIERVPVTEIKTVTVTERVPVTEVKTVTVTAPAPASEPITVEVPVTQVVTVTERVPVTVVETVTVTAPALPSEPGVVETPVTRVVTVTQRVPLTIMETIHERMPITVVQTVTVTAPIVSSRRAAETWEAPEARVALFAPAAGGAYHSPLPVAGLQRPFMGTLEIYLTGPDGQILTRRSGSGMSSDVHDFRFADLRFSVEETTPATFTLAAVDAGSGMRMQEEEIPVVLLPGQSVLELYRPAPGAAVCAPLIVAGQASTSAGSLNLELRSADGELLEAATAQTGVSGAYRDFATDFDYAPSTPTPVQLIAYADSAGAASSIDYTVYPLTLYPADSLFCRGE